MRPITVEVCINSENVRVVRQAVSAASLGGASRIELCSAMRLNGLTPRRQHVLEARKAFHTREGLLVMVRPRAGDFSYSSQELKAMLRQIAVAAGCGANGAVFGVLRATDQQVSREALQELVGMSRRFALQTTFHRAFDATPDPAEALEILIACGVTRVLTCGMPWGSKGTALEGVKRIAQCVRQANGRIEVVIGGGVTRENVAAILKAIPRDQGAVSVHTYVGAQHHGVTTTEDVRSLVQSVALA